MIAHSFQQLAHIVRLYGYFLLRTSSSKLAVNRISQLALFLVGINAPQFRVNAHVDASNNMVELDQGD